MNFWGGIGIIATATSLFSFGYLFGIHGQSEELEAAFNRGQAEAKDRYELSRDTNETIAKLIGFITDPSGKTIISHGGEQALSEARDAAAAGDIAEARKLVETAFEEVPPMSCLPSGRVYAFEAENFFKICETEDYVHLTEVLDGLVSFEINGYSRELSAGQTAEATGILYGCDITFERNDPEKVTRAFLMLDC